ncbi:hypothetical protein DFH94DRAFT_703345 [Russula ochroleuca]|uniref:Secreted protein n=1 Tax=Russula ochroleuca TaxID=152965 RepID=A0A9P5N5X0_9AGAM|nr:hypothetical protein DFH94DRAFT_703345 [Russula ochroleuca]
MPAVLTCLPVSCVSATAPWEAAVPCSHNCSFAPIVLTCPQGCAPKLTDPQDRTRIAISCSSSRRNRDRGRDRPIPARPTSPAQAGSSRGHGRIVWCILELSESRNRTTHTRISRALRTRRPSLGGHYPPGEQCQTTSESISPRKHHVSKYAVILAPHIQAVPAVHEAFIRCTMPPAC